MVAAPWRRLTQAARWKPLAPQSTTGVARPRLSHCQPLNCSGGTIASRITGTERTALTISFSRRAAVGSFAGSVSASGAVEGTEAW